MLQPGQVLRDRYQLKQLLGQNASRQTWLSEDLQSDPPESVVVKLLAFGAQVQWDDLKLFEREASVLKQLNHSYIPRYRDYFCLNDRALWFGLVQESINGSSLKDLLTQGQKFTEAEVRKIAAATLEILTYLHELNPAVLHRDIKPSNLIWSADHHIYLVDFGAVQDRAAAEGATFTVVGTYGYAPIEQFGGRAVPSSDLYALGATLIHLLTGTAPADLPQRDLRIQFRDRTSASPSLVDWIEALTEPSVERRQFSTAQQALEALKSGRTSRSPLRKVQQPASTRIKIFNSPDRLLIHVPGPKLSFANVGDLCVKLGLLSVIALGLLASSLWALFELSVPAIAVLGLLWLVWTRGLLAVLESGLGYQQIRLDRHTFVIEWKLFQHCLRQQKGAIASIQDVFQSVQITDPHSWHLSEIPEREMVTIQTDAKRYSFGLGLTAMECLWIAQGMKDWLKLL